MSDNPLLKCLHANSPPWPACTSLVEKSLEILREVWQSGVDAGGNPWLTLEPLPPTTLLCHGTLASRARILLDNPRHWETAGWLNTRLGPGLYVFREGNAQCPKEVARRFVESRRTPDQKEPSEVLIIEAHIGRALDLDAAANQPFLRKVVLRFVREMENLIDAATDDPIYRAFHRGSHFVALLLHAEAARLGWSLPQAITTEFLFEYQDGSETRNCQQQGLVLLDPTCIVSATSHCFSL